MKRIPVRTLGVCVAAFASGVLVAQALLGGPTMPGPGSIGQFPAPGAREKATVWAVGDGADGSVAARKVARPIRAGKPSRLLYLGDVYGSGSASEFRDNYGTTPIGVG